MSILQQLLNELAETQKHTNPSTTHSNPNVHGPNSLFGVSGLERDVISSRVVGEGLASVLPVRDSVTKYPQYPYISGKQPATGSQVATSCLEAPVAGQLMTCIQTAKFGLYMFQTRNLELNTVGAIIDAGETTDFRFVNDPLALQMGQIWLNIPNKDLALRLGREVLMRFVEVGADFQELLSQQIYIGDGATSNEFPGLEQLVVTDHYDARTGNLCQSLASDVRNFGDVDITTSVGAAALVDTLVDMVRFAHYKADKMGFNPVQFALVMRDQAFIKLSDIWPCAFMSSGCVPTNSNVAVNINTDEQLRMRIAMQSEKYLPIDGKKIRVITDSWMPETDLGNNLFSSDIYLLPLTVTNGRQVLYFETFNYNAGVNQALLDGKLSSEFWIDNGRYLVAKKPQTNFCVGWQVKIEPRLRLETPQLAGRLSGVAMTLGTHWYDPGTSSLYSINSGNPSGYGVPSLYNQWDNIP